MSEEDVLCVIAAQDAVGPIIQWLALDPTTDQIIVGANWDAFVPQITGNVDLGTVALKFGWSHINQGVFYTNLRIPAVVADPAALVSGDIWLRTDL